MVRWEGEGVIEGVEGATGVPLGSTGCYKLTGEGATGAMPLGSTGSYKLTASWRKFDVHKHMCMHTFCSWLNFSKTLVPGTPLTWRK